LAQRSQSIELLVEELSPPAHAGFPDLVQPLRAMTRCVDLLTPTGNPPASIQSLHRFITRVRSLLIVR
jgi:hypothetical protein